MMDLAQTDPRLLDDITSVIDALVSQVGLEPHNVLLVGAGCRDILHSALGHTFALRATTDTDLGVAFSDWALSERIDKQFRRTGSTGIRYLIDGLPVDIMPFGGVEQPRGISRPRPRGEDLIVFGFSDVYERAETLILPTGSSVRIPSPAGFAALKMRAWVDRSVYGEDEDARDLALAAFWYQESPAVNTFLYETEAGLEVLESSSWDVEVAATRILARDVLGQLQPANGHDLAERWSALDNDALARKFVLPATSGRVVSLERRRKLVAGLAMPLINA